MRQPTKEELEAAFCWEADDQIPRRPTMTAFRRAARFQQARWREGHHHPIGSQPIVAKPDDTRVRPVGSRMALDDARETGANFLTPAAWAAAQARVAFIEPHQSIDHQRLWCDLLSSTALAFNLFGDLAMDVTSADRVVGAWFPDVRGRVSDVRFIHSPGWLDKAYLGSLRSFVAAFVIDLDDGGRGIVAVDVKYHELNKAETPRPDNLARYAEVGKRSGVFAPGAIDTLMKRGDLCVMWIEHLLMFSMLQHPTDNWTWARHVVVHPEGNSDIADACARYRSMLSDDTSFTTITLEDLLDSGTLPATTTAALRDRYLLA